MAPHPDYILRKIVNQMEDIWFSNFKKKKKQKIILVIFTRIILIFLKFMEMQDEGIGLQKEFVQNLISGDS